MILLTSTQNTATITFKPVNCLLEYLHHNMQAKIAVFGITRRIATSMWFFYAQNSVHINVGLSKAVERLAGYVYPVLQPCSVRLHGCSHVVGFKNLIHGGIMPNFYTQEPTKTLNLSVSSTKKQSLQKQVEIIGHALNSFCFDSSTTNKDSLKKDTLELVRMLDDLLTQKKQGCFNILASGTNKIIADSLTYDQAMKYRNPKKYVIKFAHMAGGAS